MAAPWISACGETTPLQHRGWGDYLLDRMRFSAMEQENLNDLLGIVSSLKNKYGLAPFAAAAEGQPSPNAVKTFYLIDSLMLNKVTSVLLNTPRLQSVTIIPRGIPKSGQYELQLTLGG